MYLVLCFVFFLQNLISGIVFMRSLVAFPFDAEFWPELVFSPTWAVARSHMPPEHSVIVNSKASQTLFP